MVGVPARSGVWARFGLPDLGLLAMAALLIPGGPAEWRLAALIAGIGIGGLLAERRMAESLWGKAGGDGLERLVLAGGLGLVVAQAVSGVVHLLPARCRASGWRAAWRRPAWCWA